MRYIKDEYKCNCGNTWFRSVLDRDKFIHRSPSCFIVPEYKKVLEEDLLKLLRKPRVIKIV